MAQHPGLHKIGDVLIIGVAVGIDLMVWHGHSDLRGGQAELDFFVIPALTAVIYPALLWRWRYPRCVFVLHWTYTLAGTILLPEYVPFMGLLVALHALARRDIRWAANAGLIACVAPFAVNSYNVVSDPDHVGPVLDFAGIMLLWAALALTVWGLGRIAYITEQRDEQLRQEQAAAAVRAERLFLARELHDVVSHSVSAMIFQAAGARTLVPRDEEQVRAALEAIETTGVQAMEELHRLLGLLRKASSERAPEGSTRPPSLHDLDSLIGSARASGVDVEVIVEGHPEELDRSVGLAAYRIVQEALTNTIKHAGRGAASRVHLRWEVDGLTLTIRDRAGFQDRDMTGLSSGHGLAGLAERVSLVGGTLESGLTANGYLVRAHLPTRPPTPPHVFPVSSSKDPP